MRQITYSMHVRNLMDSREMSSDKVAKTRPHFCRFYKNFARVCKPQLYVCCCAFVLLTVSNKP